VVLNNEESTAALVVKLKRRLVTCRSAKSDIMATFASTCALETRSAVHDCVV
jgi:hypothetical protein